MEGGQREAWSDTVKAKMGYEFLWNEVRKHPLSGAVPVCAPVG